MTSALPPSAPPPTVDQPPGFWPPPPPPGPAPRPQLRRSRSDKVIGGVAGGLAEYFDIDPIITRLAFAALAFVGGAGILLYIGALLLVPQEGDGDHPAPAHSGRTATIAGVVVLILAAGALLEGGWWSHGGDGALWLLGAALLGLGVWWLASGESPAGSGRDVMRRMGLGLALLALCFVLAAGAFWAAAAGGDAVVAGIVIAAGAAMVVAAFAGGARWLILPALAVALPAALVAAAGIDLRGGMGERTYAPTSATAVASGYEMGAGRMVVDLRRAGLPPGDRRLNLRLGAGQAVVVVPDDVCVAPAAKVGAGDVQLFDRHQGGVDLDVVEHATAPPSTTRLLVDAHLGVGQLQFRHTPPRHDHDQWRYDDTTDAGTNAACTGGTA
jgi:phage shock protein PspC (stress-responsive transcriptional regulator)